jgi:hypothetical protein
VQVAAAVDGPHPVPAAGQLMDQGAADAEHDLQVNRCGHGPSLRVGDSTTKPLRLRVRDADTAIRTTADQLASGSFRSGTQTVGAVAAGRIARRWNQGESSTPVPPSGDAPACPAP